VREHYLRDDIYSGSPLDPECDPASYKLSAEAPLYLVVDTNIVLHQMDLLEHAAVSDAVVTSVVLEEARARNSSVYQRLRGLVAAPAKRFYVFANEHHADTFVTAQPGESPNDRNDRAIRVAAAWYAARLPAVRVVLLTDDADSRRKAAEMGVEAMSAAEYARLRAADAPELADLVAAGRAGGDAAADAAAAAADAADGPGGRGAAGRGGKRRRVYEDHRPMSEVTAGIKAGRYHQGALRVSRFNPFEGWVGSESAGQDLLIQGRVAMNRAMDGDIVAVELLPEEQWAAPSARLPAAAEGGAEGGAEEGGDEGGEGGAHVAQVDPGEHYGEDAGGAAAGAAAGRRPTGKVVGVIKRNWRTRGYCGSLQPPRAGAPAPADGAPASLLFCPVERRFPMVRLSTRQAGTLADKRLVVAVDSWEADSLYPQGHYVRTLGDIGDREVETEVILIEHDVNTAPFSPAVHACVPPLPWAVGAAELADPDR
jgi:exosome complex exonuclease DIS3/RRP44